MRGCDKRGSRIVFAWRALQSKKAKKKTRNPMDPKHSTHFHHSTCQRKYTHKLSVSNNFIDTLKAARTHTHLLVEIDRGQRRRRIAQQLVEQLHVAERIHRLVGVRISPRQRRQKNLRGSRMRGWQTRDEKSREKTSAWTIFVIFLVKYRNSTVDARPEKVFLWVLKN